MKAKPYKITDAGGYTPCKASEATHVELHMPGPISFRMLPVIIKGERRGTPCWTWNGEVDFPTLKPSILSTGGGTGTRCHSFVNDGRVQFLTDTTHEFSGMTVDLLEVE